MQITIETNDRPSSFDEQILRSWLDRWEPAGDQAEPEPAEEEKPKKTTRAKKKTEPEPEEEALDQELLDKAIAKATELLKAKETELVKKALADAGVQRVSHLNSNEQIRQVLKTFEEADE